MVLRGIGAGALGNPLVEIGNVINDAMIELEISGAASVSTELVAFGFTDAEIFGGLFWT